MQKFTEHSGVVISLDRPNVDTDAIIPKQYLKSVKRTGFGPTLFDDWRYIEPGEPGMDHSQRTPNPDFVLNQPLYAEGTVLLARENFGCGSSREHAVWALTDYGIRAVIAPSFADIFFSNSFKNGLLPIALSDGEVDQIFSLAQQSEAFTLSINLEEQLVSVGDQRFSFEIDDFKKYCMLNGLDEIGLTLKHVNDIRAYEECRKQEAPWLFGSV